MTVFIGIRRKYNWQREIGLLWRFVCQYTLVIYIYIYIYIQRAFLNFGENRYGSRAIDDMG